MKKHYDFLNGERGKYFFNDADFLIPKYLEPETQPFINKTQMNKKDPSKKVIAMEICEGNSRLPRGFYNPVKIKCNLLLDSREEIHERKR